MKKKLYSVLVLLVTVVMLLPLVPTEVFAAAENSRFYILPEDNEGLTFAVGSYDKSGSESYMFLPNTVNAAALKVRYSGTVRTVSALDGATVTFGSTKLIFMQSSLPSMNIVLNAGESLDTINASKDAKIGASVAISGADNDKYNLPYTAIQMKTRGNTTFWPDKKPYQIKFDKKTNLFGMGKAKKWILLANYYDGTCVRTKVFFDLAQEIGLSNTSESVFVDLYIDGDYRGVYQLIEKIEAGDSRVDLKDEAGVILEMDTPQRISDINDPYFMSAISARPFAFKETVFDFEDTTPEGKAKISRIKAFAENHINNFESAIYAKDPDWNTISSMIDVDSFILYYFLNEYGEQVDCMYASTYFYIDGPGDVLHCGPCWDFDRICGFNDPVPANTDYLKNLTDTVDRYRCEWYKELFRNPEFVARANELYESVVKPAFDTAKVNAMIDSYQQMIMPSLRMNHVKWVVFYDRCYTTDELVSGSTDVLVKYITDHIKGILATKKTYMDKAYGRFVPTLTYTLYDSTGSKLKEYTGGCMSYQNITGGIGLDLSNVILKGGIQYTLYYNGTPFATCSDGESAISPGGFFNALSVNLTGYLSQFYSVEYRVFFNGKTWTDWSSDGNVCGRTKGGAVSQYKIARVQMRLVQKAPVVLITGDINTDGVITAKDVASIKNVLVGAENSANADANGDGVINAHDLAFIKELLVQ